VNGASWEQLAVPAEVASVLHDIRAILLLAGVRSAILTGSAARGELSYSRDGGRLVLRSDIELYVVADNPSRARRHARPQLDVLERRLSAEWPGFHVDAAFLTPRQLSGLPPYIRHYELKQNGVTLCGDDLRYAIPEIDIGNLDWRELNDTILWRLTTLLAALPTAWIARTGPLERPRVHTLARSLLDVTLWALPGLGVLLPTFGQRIGYWSSEPGRQALEGAPLPAPELMSACFASRLQSAFGADPDELLSEAIRSWSWAYAVATDRTKWPHRGAGAGFSTYDAARRLRFAVRALAGHAGSARSTVEHGYALPAADAARGLLEAAASLRSGCDPHEKIVSAARALGAGVDQSEPVRAWADTRRRLLRYLDTVTGRAEWEWRVTGDADKWQTA